jgi:hypothetical protein
MTVRSQHLKSSIVSLVALVSVLPHKFERPMIVRRYEGLFLFSPLSQHSHEIRLSWPPLAWRWGWGLPFYPFTWGLWSNKLDEGWKSRLPVKLPVTRSQRLQHHIGTIYYRLLKQRHCDFIVMKRKDEVRVLSGDITFLPNRQPDEQFVQTFIQWAHSFLHVFFLLYAAVDGGARCTNIFRRLVAL